MGIYLLLEDDMSCKKNKEIRSNINHNINIISAKFNSFKVYLKMLPCGSNTLYLVVVRVFLYFRAMRKN